MIRLNKEIRYQSLALFFLLDQGKIETNIAYENPYVFLLWRMGSICF